MRVPGRSMPQCQENSDWRSRKRTRAARRRSSRAQAIAREAGPKPTQIRSYGGPSMQDLSFVRKEKQASELKVLFVYIPLGVGWVKHS